jgi:hypothetical protein
MIRAVLATVSILIWGTLLVGAQNSEPVAEWRFDETSGQVAHDAISGTDDTIVGLFKRAPGVSGNGLRFDGLRQMILKFYWPAAGPTT